MRIVIAAKHPPGGRLAIGGVQSWADTVGAMLSASGHSVTFWGPEWPMPEVRFDAGIFANLRHTAPMLPACAVALKLSHGIVRDEQGGAGFSATSEEVRDKWRCDGPVIRQPIDLALWSPADGPRRYFTRFSYRGGLACLPQIAAERGLEYMHLRAETPERVREVLKQSAVVVATGRAAVEAMACGAPVVIADDREYQGHLLDPDPFAAMRRNYSGRGGIAATPPAMRQAIDAAIARGSLRSHAEQHHDARAIVREIECLLS